MQPACGLTDGALFTDLYELTMMQGYHASGRGAEWGVFELFFRTVPEGGGYCVAAGIEDVIAAIPQLAFRTEHLEYLASLRLFQPDFLALLRTLRFTGDVWAVREGTVVFPNEPLLVVAGPLLEAQWLETLLLNFVNFQTLIATKASRIVRTARPAAVVEFGLRRAQGPNGGRWVSKAAYLAGCVGTSNVEAGYLFGIPVYGTHAHSWVQSFDSEQAAFDAYARAFPDHCIFLVDTYDTLRQGIPKAIATAKQLEAAGHRAVGIRLDSGDLAYLSKEGRKLLDAAGLDQVKIVASSDIDEYVIESLKVQQAPIDVFGVGTRLATAYQEPALNGVYKLVAVRKGNESTPKMKISSNPAKTTIPGQKQIWRWTAGGQYQGDALAFLNEPAPRHMRHPDIDYKQTDLPPRQLEPLLELRIKSAEPVCRPAPLAECRRRVQQELALLPPEHQRLSNPHAYRVGLSDALWQLRRELIAALA